MKHLGKINTPEYDFQVHLVHPAYVSMTVVTVAEKILYLKQTKLIVSIKWYHFIAKKWGLHFYMKHEASMF